MKRLHIFNPVSGSGHSPDLLKAGAAANEESYVTTCIGDAEKFTYNVCLERPDTHFVVYGGDGTANEVANGIIKAGAGSKALMTVIPAGTGNDFVRTLNEKNTVRTIDVIKYNGRYAINIINFGFDSNVVSKTNKYKKIFAGSPAYIAGVADTLLHKMGEDWAISIVNENGETENLSGMFTLALVGNCKYYGGGFKSAPLADPSDGLLDFVAVKKVSKLTFINLVGDYKKGLHLDPETMTPTKKCEKYLTYRRVKKITIKGIKNICADGEIEETDSIEVSVVPNALRIAT